MALCRRIRPTDLGSLHPLRRSWRTLLPAAGGSSVGQSAGWRWSAATATAWPPSRSFDYFQFRSFAAPVQAPVKGKPANDASDGPRLNQAITAPVIRLVTDEGHSILATKKALEQSMKLNLDLVEVQRTANPPVCKIMDYHKEKYNMEVKRKERAKTKSALSKRSGENKEVRFKAKTEPKDLKVKADGIIRLTERGYRVKCMAVPAGDGDEDLAGPLSSVLSLIQDVSVVESGPHVEARQAYVIVRHAKFVTKKSVKKVSSVMDMVKNGIQTTTSNVPDTSLESDEEWESAESNPEIDDGDQSDHTEQEAFPPAVKPSKLTRARDGGFDEKSSASGSPAVDTNRYATRSELKGRFPQQKAPQQTGPFNNNNASRQERSRRTPTRSGDQVQGQYNNNEKRLDHPGNRPSPSPNYRNPFASGNPNTPPISFGVFSNAKAPSSEQKSSGDAVASKPDRRDLPRKHCGVFSGSRTTCSSDENNSGDKAVHAPKLGIFTSTKLAGSGDSTDVNNARPGNPRSAAPRFGVFSNKRSAASDNQS